MGERHKNSVFVLQVGAMDGKTHDPLHEFITRFAWRGLLVEPVAESFARLCETYENQPQLKLVRTAIAERKGEAIMHKLADPDAEDAPNWAHGAASLYSDRNALGFDEVKARITTETVPVTTLPALLEDHGVQCIDIMQIDAEGHDYHILKQLDFARYQPTIINFEIVNLPKAEQTAAKQLLDKQGYLYAKAGYDLFCVQPGRFFS